MAEFGIFEAFGFGDAATDEPPRDEEGTDAGAAATDDVHGTIGPASGTLDVTPTNGIDSSGYGHGAFVFEKAEQDIHSQRLDLSDATFEDLVFDPEGKAGDVLANASPRSRRTAEPSRSSDTPSLRRFSRGWRLRELTRRGW